MFEYNSAKSLKQKCYSTLTLYSNRNSQKINPNFEKINVEETKIRLKFGWKRQLRSWVEIHRTYNKRINTIWNALR